MRAPKLTDLLSTTAVFVLERQAGRSKRNGDYSELANEDELVIEREIEPMKKLPDQEHLNSIPAARMIMPGGSGHRIPGWR